MDWLSKLARETEDQESAAKASERDNEAAFNRVYSQFNSAIASRFDRYAATLKTSSRYPYAISRSGTYPVGSKFWDISNVGISAISLKLEGGAYHEAKFYLTGFFDNATESTFGDDWCDADDFSIEWLDSHMEPILRKALLG